MTLPRIPIAALWFFALLSITEAFGRPPENADSALAPWFQGQAIPGLGVSCCSQADGRAVDFRIVGDHYEAYLTKKAFPDAIDRDHWEPVPQNALLEHQNNPTGRAIAWVIPYEWQYGGHTYKRGSITCFVLPAMA